MAAMPDALEKRKQAESDKGSLKEKRSESQPGARGCRESSGLVKTLNDGGF